MKSFTKQRIFLILIILLAFILRIYWLDRADMQGDETTYSFRAIGYQDFLDSEQQTTPVQWFNGQTPWWSKLSFHDAPPLVFIVQYIFFKIFGVSAFTARLPFVLFGTAAVYLLYLVIKKLFKAEGPALGGALLLAVLNYHVWISRVGYLEGILLFFILLSFYFLLRLSEQPKLINYCLVGLSLGLAFLCKYTMLFLLPAFLFYLIFFARKTLVNKNSLLIILIFLIIISPVIIFNVMVYQTRGHLDLQFSQLFKMDISQDWSLFTKGGGAKDYWQNFSGIFLSLKDSLGLVYFCLAALGLIYMIYCLYKNSERRKFYYLILFCLLFLILQFNFTGVSTRFLPIFTPFLIMLIVILLNGIYQKINKKIFKNLAILIFILLITYSAMEVIATHWLKNPTRLSNPTLRWENYGFRQLEEYFSKQDFDPAKTLVIYDGRLNWFCRLWYFLKQMYYNQGYNISIELFLTKINEEGEDYFLKKVKGLNQYYFLYARDTLMASDFQSDAGEKFKEFLTVENSYKPELIYRDNGQAAFEVYSFK